MVVSTSHNLSRRIRVLTSTKQGVLHSLLTFQRSRLHSHTQFDDLLSRRCISLDSRQFLDRHRQHRFPMHATLHDLADVNIDTRGWETIRGITLSFRSSEALLHAVIPQQSDMVAFLDANDLQWCGSAILHHSRCESSLRALKNL